MRAFVDSIFNSGILCRHDSAISPRVSREFKNVLSSCYMGAGNGRAPNALAASCVKKQTHECSHHGYTGIIPAFPAQWFYGLYRPLPGDEFLLSPSPAD